MAILETETSIAELKELFGKDAIFYEWKGKKIMRSRPFLSNAQIKKRKNHALSNMIQIKAFRQLANLLLSDPVKKAEYKAKCKGKQRPNDLLTHELMEQQKQTPEIPFETFIQNIKINFQLQE
jgi:hypothetical protein